MWPMLTVFLQIEGWWQFPAFPHPACLLCWCSFCNISSYILGINHFNKRSKQGYNQFDPCNTRKSGVGTNAAQYKTADLEIPSPCWLLCLQAQGFHTAALCSELYNAAVWVHLCPLAPSQIQLHCWPYDLIKILHPHHLITCRLNLFWAISNFSNYTKLFKSPQYFI